MRDNTLYTNNKPEAPDALLKTTALLYLTEAIRNQEFEQCSALIKSAKRFGARKSEIRKVLREYAVRGKVGRHNEAKQLVGGRLRYLKED